MSVDIFIPVLGFDGLWKTFQWQNWESYKPFQWSHGISLPLCTDDADWLPWRKQLSSWIGFCPCGYYYDQCGYEFSQTILWSFQRT